MPPKKHRKKGKNMKNHPNLPPVQFYSQENLLQQVSNSHQAIQRFRGTASSTPVFVTIIVDGSGSMNTVVDKEHNLRSIDLVRLCLEQFLRAIQNDTNMKPYLDGGFQLSLISFNDTVQLLHTFIPIIDSSGQTISVPEFKATSSTYMGDALMVALNQLNVRVRSENRPIKKVIFLMTDGENTNSVPSNVANLNAFKSAARESNVLVVPIAIGKNADFTTLKDKVSTCKDNQVLYFTRSNTLVFQNLCSILAASVRSVSDLSRGNIVNGNFDLNRLIHPESILYGGVI